MRKSLLILLFDGSPPLLERRVGLKLGKALQKCQILQPSITLKDLGSQLGKTRITLVQPATRSDSVGDISEFLDSVELDEVLQDGSLLKREGEVGRVSLPRWRRRRW